jgi:hypothetical protein
MSHFPPSIRAAFAAIALAAGTMLVSAAPVLAADNWRANDDDSLLLDVRSGRWRVGDGVRGYHTDTGVCVDLADAIIALDLPVRLDKKSRRATGWLFNERRTITIDRDQNTVQIVNKQTKLLVSDIRDTPEGWCVDTQVLANWIDVGITVDLSNSLLVLTSATKLPFELAEERKERAGKFAPKVQFDLSKLPQGNEPYKFWRTPSVDVVASTGVRDRKLRGATFDARYEIFASGEAAGASFDARLSSDDHGVPRSLRIRGYRTDANAGLLGPLKATHFGLGDVSSESTALGMANSVGRGAFVTNRPVERPENFDRTSFRGELPDGWDAELYRNDQLIAYAQTRGDGRYEFLDIPLLFGQNRMEVILYGPQGQTRRDVKLIPVGLDSIPPKETYYWAGLIDGGRDLFNFGSENSIFRRGLRGGFGIERGLNARTSIASTFSSVTIDNRRRYYLEAALRRSIGPALLELTGASDLDGGYASRLQALGQIGDTNFSAETAFFSNRYQSERYEAQLQRLFAISVDQNFRLGKTNIPFRLEARQQKFASGRELREASLKTSFNINRLNISTGLAWQQIKQIFGTGPPSNLEASLRLSGNVGGVRLRGETRYALMHGGGLRESSLTAEVKRSEKAEWRADASYNGQTKRARLGLGYTRKFAKFAITGQIEGASDGNFAAGLNLAFSLGPDPRGGFRIASDKLASTGQVMAIVYHDINGDGIRQAGEPTEKAVEITAGQSGQGSPTDGTGTSFLDNLQPFKPILVSINASTLPDPFVQPAQAGVVVTPRPGVAQIVELSLVSAGEITGTLIRDDGKILSGVDIELLDKTGAAVKITRSEYDGYFLFESVPYGFYALRISTLAANITGIDARLPYLAKLADGIVSVDLGQVIAKSAPRIAVNSGGAEDKAESGVQSGSGQ